MMIKKRTTTNLELLERFVRRSATVTSIAVTVVAKPSHASIPMIAMNNPTLTTSS